MGVIVPQSADSRPQGRALTFVAIDFETADHGPDSACAVGLVRVSGNRIVKRKYYLIRPTRRSFFFTPVHGITRLRDTLAERLLPASCNGIFLTRLALTPPFVIARPARAVAIPSAY